MTRWLLYLKMEFRKGMALIPFFVVSALLTGAVLIAAAVLFCVVTEEQQLFPKAQVAVVMNSDGTDDTSEKAGRADLKTSMAIGLVESMSSVKSLCEFRYSSPKEAADGLRDGSLSAAIYLPEGTYENINTGVNTPVLFRLSASQSAFSGGFFRQLVTDGVSFIRTIESAIYAVDRQSTVNPPVTSIGDAEDKLFGIFLQNALGRMSAFSESGVSLFGALSMMQFYAISILALILLLFGIGCASFYNEGERATLQYLRRFGLKLPVLSSAKWITLTIVFAILTFVFTGVAGFAGRVMSDQMPGAEALRSAFASAAKGLPVMVALAFSVAAFVHLVYTFVSPKRSALLYLLLAAAMFCLAGGLLPLTFLPDSVRGIFSCLPLPLWQGALSRILYPDAAVTGVFPELPAAVPVILSGVLMLIPAWIRESSVIPHTWRKWHE